MTKTETAPAATKTTTPSASPAKLRLVLTQVGAVLGISILEQDPRFHRKDILLRFEAPNGFEIISAYVPEVDPPSRLYLLGNDPSRTTDQHTFHSVTDANAYVTALLAALKEWAYCPQFGGKPSSAPAFPEDLLPAKIRLSGEIRTFDKAIGFQVTQQDDEFTEWLREIDGYRCPDTGFIVASENSVELLEAAVYVRGTESTEDNTVDILYFDSNEERDGYHTNLVTALRNTVAAFRAHIEDKKAPAPAPVADPVTVVEIFSNPGQNARVLEVTVR